MNIDQITIDGGTQSRSRINEETVADYAEAILQGACFPPIIVYFDGIKNYLADGFHRYFAHKRAKRKEIVAEVVSGTLRDAVLHSLGANALHGLRRTNDDKRNSVFIMLEDVEWSDWSDAEIARLCHVSHPFVAKLRKEQKQTKVVKKFQHKSGKVTTMKVNKEEVEDDIKHDVINVLHQENEELKTQLATSKLEFPEGVDAETLIRQLREEIRLLKIENEALRLSRDQFQDENAQLKRQIRRK